MARSLTGDIVGAIEDFHSFVAWASAASVYTETVQQRQGWIVVLQAGLNPVNLARQGKIVEALAIYLSILSLSPAIPLSADDWNSLCWHGAHAGYAADTLFACDTAVRMVPDNGNYHDSRGFARATVGNIDGALADFQAYLDWASTTLAQKPAEVEKRRNWFAALEDGENPVRATLLAQTGQHTEALQMYAALRATPGFTVTAGDWNTLCWHGNWASTSGPLCVRECCGT